jgi:hypothetical protein
MSASKSFSDVQAHAPTEARMRFNYLICFCILEQLHCVCALRDGSSESYRDTIEFCGMGLRQIRKLALAERLKASRTA